MNMISMTFLNVRSILLVVHNSKLPINYTGWYFGNTLLEESRAVNQVQSPNM